MCDEEKKAARQAVNALVATGNKDLIDLGLSMMPQEDKDNIAAIVRKVEWYQKVADALVEKYPRLNRWLSRERVKEVVPGSSLVMSDAIDTLLKMVENDEAKVVLFFDTIILDDDAMSIAMPLLCMLPILIDNTVKENPDITEEELKEGSLQELIKRLHAVPHVPEFPATPEALYKALKAVFN